MPQDFFPLQSESERFGSAVAQPFQAFAKGLATEHYSTKDILARLADQKAKQVEARHFKKLVPGLSDEQAEAFVNQPQWLQQAATQGGYLNQPSNNGYLNQQVAPQQQLQQNALQRLQGAGVPPQLAQQFAGLSPEAQNAVVAKAASVNPVLAKALQQAQQQPQNPNAQPLQHGQMQAPQAPQAPQGPSFAEAVQSGLTAKEKAAEQKLPPTDKKFLENLESKVEFADELLPIIDEIQDLLDEGEYTTGIIASYTPNSILGKFPFGKNTQELDNRLSKLLAKYTQAEGKGRGSDLMRKLIKEGKLGIGQKPEVIQGALDQLRNEQEKIVLTDQARHELFEKNGERYPADIAYKARQLAAKKEMDMKKREKLLPDINSVPDDEGIDINGVVYVKNPTNTRWVPAR